MTSFATNIQAAIEAFERDGYAKIPKVFTPAECDMIRTEAYKIVGEVPDSLQWVKDPLGNRRPGLAMWPQAYSPALEDITYSDRMKTIVRSFLGLDVRQLVSQIYYRESGDGDQFAWHQDIMFRTPPADFADIENGYLQTIIVVDKITDENGAVEFILRSHKQGNLNLLPRDDSNRGLREFKRDGRRGIKATAEPGDVLLWHVLTVHGSEPNNSGQNRMTFMNGYARDSAIAEGKLQTFPQYLMGGM